MADDDTRKHSTPRMTTRAACDALRRSPWTLRCGGLLLLGLLAWMVASWATPDAAAKKAAIRAALGSGTWNMLHRLTVKYPKRPTPQQRHDVHEFFRLFSWHYPCEECAGHFREMLAEFPIEPHSTDNQALSKWLCGLHNRVNERLNKRQFSCTLESLKEAYGECGCFDEPLNATKATGGGGDGASGAALLTQVGLKAHSEHA